MLEWVARKVTEAAIRAEAEVLLSDLVRQLESGLISESEFDDLEDRLLDRFGPEGAPG